MKKIVVLLITIAMLLSLVQAITAVQPGDQEEPIPEQPISFDISQLFIDGRTITADDISRMIKHLGLYYRTDANGNKTLMVSNRIIMIIALEESEDIDTILNDSEAKKALITRLGYNSDYFDIDYCGTYKELYPRTFAENEYDFYYSLTPEACELLNVNEMSIIERIYLSALVLYGQGYMTSPLMGAEDYTKTEDYKRDVNLDGAFNVKDLVAFKKYVAGSTIMVNIDACDINGDGIINARDIAVFKKVIANG